jgi:hypothetical protein
VADAFRFTKVAETCDKVGSAGLITLHITSPKLDTLNSSLLETGLASYPDMRIALHEAMVEATKLSRESIHLLSIRKGSVIADFEVRGTESQVKDLLSSINSQIADVSETDLKRSLCKAVLSDPGAGCKVTVMQSLVQPPPDPTEYIDQSSIWPFVQSLESPEPSWAVVVLVPCGVICAIIMLVVLCLRWRRKQKIQTACEDPVVEISTEDEIAHKDDSNKDTHTDDLKGKVGDDEISVAGSTATPTSDHSQLDIDVQSQGSGAVICRASTKESSQDLV